ncbi:hypothetical protein ABE82_25950 (plasmid) [Paenibacillus peoriae]|uniref:hypothetical protein n=1 Tax=Paenibacillus peoriae TaxID=59893 RepID=UPI000721B9D9|nr:hypothetical protein [Paenibacillus peoriae]ALS09865.1 hypothetical protein ABE82_25950 [Paenibacillus peoriae]
MKEVKNLISISLKKFLKSGNSLLIEKSIYPEVLVWNDKEEVVIPCIQRMDRLSETLVCLGSGAYVFEGWKREFNASEFLKCCTRVGISPGW